MNRDANSSISSPTGRHHPNGNGRGKDFNITDSELVMALFLHHCDARRVEQDLRHYSGTHFLVDLVRDDDDTNKQSGLLALQSPQQVSNIVST